MCFRIGFILITTFSTGSTAAVELEVDYQNTLSEMEVARLDVAESDLSLESEIVSEHNAEEGGYFGQ